MYYDSKHDRILLRNGTSVVSPWRFAQMTVEGLSMTDVYALDSHDSNVYDLHYSSKSSKDIEEIEVHPIQSHDETDEQYDNLVSRIINSPRYKDNSEYFDRIEHELEFFVRTKNVVFLIKCMELVDRMKTDKVVWGVGRGSSCASLILYLLEVTDIDPVEFDISFSELSKEIEESKWE